MSFTVALFTDYDYYGNPIEFTRVRVTMEEAAIPYEQELKRLANARLHHNAKRMPHQYWKEGNHAAT